MKVTGVSIKLIVKNLIFGCVYIGANRQKDEIDKNVYEIFSIEKGALHMHMNLNIL